jgi:hypothetical protein
MAGSVSISPRESQKEIEALIAKELTKMIGPVFKGALKPIKSGVREAVHGAILNCPEMQSLNGGALQWDIGLPSGQAAAVVNGWANAVANSVIVEFKPIKIRSKTATGGIIIEIQPSDYNNRLRTDLRSIWGDNMEDTTYVAEVDSLLLSWGDRILIGDYDIEYGNIGRSGGARMKKKKGASWGISKGLSRVPPEFAGTQNNNFITRALGNAQIQSEIEKIILDALKGKK